MKNKIILLSCFVFSYLNSEEVGRCEVITCREGELKISDEDGVNCLCTSKELGKDLLNAQRELQTSN
jgi:hypothetical protein